MPDTDDDAPRPDDTPTEAAANGGEAEASASRVTRTEAPEDAPPAAEDRRADTARTRLTDARARLVEAQVRRAEVKAQARSRRLDARERRARAREELRARELQMDEAASLRRHRLAALMFFCGGGFAALFVALCLWFAFFGSAPQGEYAKALLHGAAIALAGGGALHLVLQAARATLRR